MQRIRLSENFRAVFYAPFYATIALGCFRDEGIDVDLVESSAPGGGPLGLLDGSVDASWGGPMRVMRARDENGPDYVCFCEVVRRDPFYLVGRPGPAPFKLADLAHARLGSVAEVPTPWMCLQHDLREIGTDPGDITRVSDRTMAENLDAVLAGTLDIAQVFEPFAELGLVKGLSILHAQSARGPTSYTTLLGTRASIDRHRDAYAAMTRAVARMQAWLGEHDGADLAKVVAMYYPSTAPSDLARCFDRYKAAKLWADDTVVSRQGFDRLAISLQSGGFIKRLPDYRDCVADFSTSS